MDAREPRTTTRVVLEYSSYVYVLAFTIGRKELFIFFRLFSNCNFPFFFFTCKRIKFYERSKYSIRISLISVELIVPTTKTY